VPPSAVTPPALAVAGRRLFHHLPISGVGSARRLLQVNGVQVALNIQAPSGVSGSVSQALQQAINTGAFQTSLEDNGTHLRSTPCLPLSVSCRRSSVKFKAEFDFCKLAFRMQRSSLHVPFGVGGEGGVGGGNGRRGSNLSKFWQDLQAT